MEFMNNIGSSSDIYRPSLFELVAQDKLNELFKPALHYILTVYAQRYPRYLLKVHKYFDEIHTLFMLLIERHYISEWNGSFSESFYGLRRVRADSTPVRKGSEGTEEKASSIQSKNLDRLEIRNSLLFLVGLPYIKNKLDDLFDSITGGSSARILGGDFSDDEDEFDDDDDSFIQRDPVWYDKWIDTRRVENFTKSSKKSTKKLFLMTYPYIHFIYHSSHLAYYIAYLFEKTDFYSPIAKLLGLSTKRMGPEDYKAQQERTQREQLGFSQAGEGLSKPRRALYLGWVVLRYGINFLKILLPMSVFILKFLEWWTSSGNQQKSSTSYLGPLPPPPAPIKPDSSGIPLPTHHADCPICLRPRTNPAMLPTGYTFCYPCIFSYVQDNSRCPITFHGVELDEVRKLFSEDSAI